QVNQFKATIPESHIATIIYTSGTTGYPKGVMLSHKNICSCVLYSKESFPFEDAPHNKVLSFLPLNHVFERLVSYIFMYSGVSIYNAETMETIGDNLREIKPNGFTTVPRLLEKVYEKIMTKADELSGIKRALFFWALNLGKRYDVNNKNILYTLQLWLARKIIFSKWKAALGGNIEFIVTGGAACPVNLLRIFNAAGIPVYEGYGPTENSPVISVNRRAKEHNKLGTVGEPINGITVKLADDGEICVSGTTVMAGYYKHPEWTAETIKDGWLHTGDIGEWIDNKYLKITDRKKELFKTSGGKYIAPQPIENKFKEHSFIEQIMVIGDNRKFVTALIVPAFPILKGWLLHKNITINTDVEIVNHPAVIEKYNRIVQEINTGFNNVEQIKKFVLLPTEWSIDGGEMTPKLSLKRKVVLQKFEQEIENMY
ncbi:MAG: AMP-dependent synthetase/ligase, partial [Bacteroidota bacterium]